MSYEVMVKGFIHDIDADSAEHAANVAGLEFGFPAVISVEGIEYCRSEDSDGNVTYRTYRA